MVCSIEHPLNVPEIQGDKNKLEIAVTHRVTVASTDMNTLWSQATVYLNV
jgi:hypothetical protein